jgi:hypothetical protein
MTICPICYKDINPEDNGLYLHLYDEHDKDELIMKLITDPI